MKIKFLLLASVASLWFFSSCNQAKEDYKEVAYFTMNGDELERPKDYRTWVYVGTPTTPNDMNNGKAAFPEFHNVYIDPVSYKYWKANGEWREGTILIKELVSVGSKAAVSGNGYFMGKFIGLEATIKSSKHFPNEPGNWAYFSFTNPNGGNVADKAKAFETNQCNGCHDASAADDFVFTQYYPILRDAKGVGENQIPENSANRKAPKKDPWQPSAATPENIDIGIPLDTEGLFAYLKEGKYKSFKNREKEKHPSTGPHTKLGLPVQVYMNDAIATSLAENKEEHPMGSTIVKEMYSEDGTLAGWAVMAKTQDTTDGGNGWFWYEVTSTEDPNELAAKGNGVVGCISCHNAGGRDMVRTAFPFKG
ncbi:cytochrome P460 family protein [Aquimarina sp. 2201CG5-10]|uniref:cytochrome P460 family protein n=1 Tax=Aquimarina callyspongiae TaxID=3098150 RepID=UPI002AB3310A|nr:cytochrome P460 family protein [Aquimarina sp. 2201CG5-10]MDY8137067.1 cytochrome P460 family protein [Aquimarina sp. 2201CG5-10]